MARSSGYRANKESAARVAELRAKLGECNYSQWQRASCIMQEIAALTSTHNTGSGPSNARVEPRACKYCGYYGHTKQHCQKRERDEEASEEAAYQRMMLQERQYQLEKEEQRQRYAAPKELPWYQRASQADVYDEMKVPWYRDKWVGPMVVSPGKDGGQGKWVRRGGTVKRADEQGRRILPVTARDVRS